MKDSITVIIPTHERHHILVRAIEYYGQLDVSVLIVDSSHYFLDKKLPENITYMHLPESLFGDKIYAGLCSVSTPFSCLGSDDDFLAENGLKVGKKFLEENLDYVSVQGHYIQFDPSFPNEKYNPLYLKMVGYKNDSNIIKDRVLDALRVPHIYALHRTAVLRKSIYITLDLAQVSVVEISVPLVAMCYGKHAVLPVFWNARDIVRYSRYLDEIGNDYQKIEGHNEINKLNKVVSNWKNFLISPEGKKLRNNFIDAASDVVADSKEARDLFDSAFIVYLSLSKPENNISFMQKLKNISKLFLPNFVVRKIQLNNYDRLRLALKSVSGYPWSNNDAMKDWNSMTGVILKFRDLK